MKGKKFDDNKLRLDLLPTRPLEQVADVLSFGAKKYGDRNWEKGLRWGRCYAAALRHIFAWWRGENVDKDSGKHPLACAIAELMFILEFTETHPELDDRVIDRSQRDTAICS